MSMSPQTQKEVAKLIQAMKDLLMGFGGLFKKDHGKHVATLNEDEMARLHHNVTELAREQRELAETFEEKEPHKALYLNARAEVMESIGEEISPEKLAQRSVNPLDVSPEAFEKRMQDKIEGRLKDLTGNDRAKLAQATIEFRKMDISEMQKLDQKLVEKRFNIGNKTERPVFAGLATGESTLKELQRQERDNFLSAGKLNGKMADLVYSDGRRHEKDNAPKNEPTPGQNRNRDNNPSLSNS